MLFCPPVSPGVCSNSCPLSWWCSLTISLSTAPFSFCLQFFATSGSFPVSQFFASGGQRIGASASASIFQMNIQGWFPLGFTGLISLLSKGLSRVFSSTTVRKHQFFGIQPSLWSNSHIHSWPLEKPKLWLSGSLLAKTLESPLDCKEIQPVHPNGDQSWVFHWKDWCWSWTLILWPPHAKIWLIGKDPDAGRDWGRRRKGR